jgi:hypothetical protein
MKKQSSKRRSSIFLMEIILAILFFSLVSAVCLQVFVRAHTLSRDSSRLNLSVAMTGSFAQLVQGADDTSDAMELIQEEYPDAQIEDDSVSLLYEDEILIRCTPVNSQQAGLVTWEICSWPASDADSDTDSEMSEDSVIYKLEQNVYYGQNADSSVGQNADSGQNTDSSVGEEVQDGQ